jgi:ABC-2 type transport system ATP-binding protein
VIEVDELTKKYDGKIVVDGVSFSVEEGEIFAILGPNGAGEDNNCRVDRRTANTGLRPHRSLRFRPAGG